MPPESDISDIVIYGGGLLGRQVHYLVATYYAERFKILGFVDDVQEKGSYVVDGLVTLGGVDQVSKATNMQPNQVQMVFAIGYSDMTGRRRAFDRAKKKGYAFASLIHPRAIIEKNVTLGEGVIVNAGSIVDQFVSVGDVCYLDIGINLCEKCSIGTNNFICSGTTFGGSVNVGDDNFFGLNSTVVNDVTIGNNNMINAASLVYRNIEDNRKLVEFREQRLVGRPFQHRSAP